MKSYHTAPIPGEKPPRRKPGFKTRSDKDHFCRMGKKLIGKKTIIISEPETITEFGSFGKVKRIWKGIARHDDTAMAALNLSRYYEEEEYSGWLYDFLEEMEDSPEKRYAMMLLEEPYDEGETSDDMFAALYLSEDEGSEAEKLAKIFGGSRDCFPEKM